MAYQLPLYPEFIIIDDPSVPTKWHDWLEGFEAMISALKVKEKKDKRAMLKHYIGSEGRKLLSKLDNTGGDDDYDTPVKALTGYFAPKMNRVFLMNSLHQIKQKPGETMDSFHMRIKEKITLLDLGDLSVDAITELITLAQIVNNCTNNSVRKKALKDGLSLKDVLDHARALERAEQQAKEIESAESSVKAVNYPNQRSKSRSRQFDKRQRSGFRPRSKSPFPRRPPSKKSCYFCGGEYPHQGRCPAEGTRCNNCKKLNHYSKVCRSRKVEKRAFTVESNESDEDYTVIPYVTIASIGNNCHKHATVNIQNQKVKFIIDTGAEINILDEATMKRLDPNKIKLTKTSKKVYAYGPCGYKRELPIMGKIQTTAEAQSKVTEAEFYIIKGEADNLLSCTTSIDLGFITFTNAVNIQNKQNIIDEYSDRFEGIGKMKNCNIKLHIDQEVSPIEQKCRRVPFHIRDLVTEELDRLEKLDIIEKAEGPTPWVSPIVVVSKKQGVRICIDSRAINTAIERERHPTPTIEDLIVDLNGAQIFSKIDLNKGYHQLELHPESRYITTFTTHAGLYRYKRLCFGINSASEIFQKAISDMLSGISGVKNLSDDIIIYAKTQEEHDNILKQVLQRMREYNITANKSKCAFGHTTIDFYGHTFSKDGISVDEKKESAIIAAGPPQNVSELRSLLGMAQYVSRFVPNFSDIVAPLRRLTHKDVKWRWNKTENDSFKRLKTMLASCESVQFFDVELPTELIVDASPFGLGAILTQISNKNAETDTQTRKVIGYASRALTDVESRYSQTEREALAVVWACEHFHLYVYGEEFNVITDHKPLEGILNKPTSKPTVRLERMCLRLQLYRMKVKYRPGKGNTADYLSRHPQKSQSQDHRSWIDQQVEATYVNAVFHYQSVSRKAISIEEIRQATSKDKVLQKVFQALQSSNWSHKDLQSYKNIKNELTIADGLLLRGDRIVVPEVLQKQIVDIAHSSHQGIVKTKSFIRETVWFPGIDRQVEDTVSSCLPCQATTKGGNMEPLNMTKLPEYPWQEVSADFCGPFSNGEYILVVMDDYSRFPEIEIVHSTSANTVIPYFDAIFARQGVPEVVKTDNGPPFNSELFSKWANTIGFHHRKITPLWPRANGEVERFMRTLKKVVQIGKLEKGSWKQDLFQFMRHYRATPHSTTSESPAKLLNGRKLRTDMPILTNKKKQVHFKDQDEQIRERDARQKQYMKELADERNRCQEHSVREGDKVLVKQDPSNKLDTPYKPKPYKVTSKKGSMVTAENENHKITRNSSFFKKIPEICDSRYDTQSEDANILDDNNLVSKDSADNVDEPPRRSERIKTIPAYLKDYVLDV